MSTRRQTRSSTKAETKTEVSKKLPKKEPDEINISEDDEKEEPAVESPAIEEQEIKSTRPKRAARQKKLVKEEEEVLSEEEEESTEKKSNDKKAKSKGRNVKKQVASKKKEEPVPVKQETEEEVIIEDSSPDIIYELDEKEMKDVNNAFNLNCSDDGEELLGSDDLKTAIRGLGFEPRVDEIKRLLKKFGNKKGKVNRDGFHRIMALKMSNSAGITDSQNDEISRVFNLLDLEKTGFITLENLKSISKELNENITDEELYEMIVEADLDGDSKINKIEFHNIMKKTSLY